MSVLALHDGAPARHHLVSVLVENKAGVLVRIAGLFTRRGFNISSLAVAPTDDARFSRLSIVVDVESAPLSQIVAQLDKLVNVLEIRELNPAEARQAELLLVTVAADAEHRPQVIELVGVYGGRIVDVGHEALTVMLAGTPDDLDGFEALMRPIGIVELQRSGRIALPKLDHEARGAALTETTGRRRSCSTRWGAPPPPGGGGPETAGGIR